MTKQGIRVVLAIASNRIGHLCSFLDEWRPWPWDHAVVAHDRDGLPSPSERDRGRDAGLGHSCR